LAKTTDASRVEQILICLQLLEVEINEAALGSAYRRDFTSSGSQYLTDQ
jgi:hypothetical protein